MKRLFHILLSAALLIILAMCFSPVVSAGDAPLEEHSLTIEYLNEDGSQAFPKYSARVMEGEEYSIESPQLEESSPDPETVEGIMGDEDVSEIVTYSSRTFYYYADKISDGHYSLDISAHAFNYSSLYDAFETMKSDLKDSSRIILFSYRNDNYDIFYVSSFDKASFKTYSENGSLKAYSDSIRVLTVSLSSSFRSAFSEGSTKYNFPTSVEGWRFYFGPDMSYFSGVPVKVLSDIEQLSIIWPDLFAKVEYQFPNGTEAAPSVSEILKKGKSFSFTSPSIKGYTPDHAVISGIMDNTPLTYKVVYTPNEYNLTIKYLYEDGSEALPPVSKKVAYKAAYNIPSPSIEGFSSDLSKVSGVMDAKDVSYTVTYTHKPLPLTVTYQYKDGSQAAASATQNIKPGTTYRVNSPSIVGYVPDIPIVSGTMPENEVSVTVTYSPKISNLVIDYLYPDGSEASPMVTKPLEYNQPYNISSPSVPNCTPDIPTVSGVMGTEDIHITVTYTKNDCRLTIKYQYKNGVSASGTYSKSYKPGDNYSIKSPSIKGYTADKAEVSGVMPSYDLTVTVTYSPIPHTLVVRYVFEDGSEAAPSYSSSVGYNDSFSVPSPAVSGFAPDRSVISGRMGSADATFTVTYKKPKYLLTVKYNHSNGTRIAKDYTGRYEEGEQYEVPSPSVMGYETQLAAVSGVMPAHDVIETVSYRLAGEPVMGDTSKLLNVISSSGEYIQVYISKTLLALVTAGLILFAAIMVVKAILYVINYFTKS